MKHWLEMQYARYNRRRYVHPDPLEFLYRYRASGDREITALIAACLAYGQVRQILKSVNDVLSRMGPTPRAYLTETAPDRIQRDMTGFVHRFARDRHISALLLAVRRILLVHGSLYSCFQSHMAVLER